MLKSLIRTMLLALFTVAIASNVYAVMVRGAPSCGSWVKNRADDSWLMRTEGSWLVGYLSGRASASNKDFLRDSNNDSLFLWVDNYCQANPLMDLDDAGIELSKELMKRARH